jgi:hypothetical protein
LAAGQLEESLVFAQDALDYRLQFEGPDAWWTNKKRLDLARILQKRERLDQATALLDELQISMAGIEHLVQEDHELLAEAAELLASIQTEGNGENE